MAELEFVIGSWPPDINSEEEFAEVEAKYEQAKRALDEQIARAPEDVELLFKRGRLQSMGHNLDLADAWQGAESDLLSVLDMQPEHQSAMVELGALYVNSDITLAPKAEEYFNRAQALHGDEPLEGAQKGLFFCYYSRGRFAEAREKAEYLVASFPDVEVYKSLLRISQKVVDAANDR